MLASVKNLRIFTFARLRRGSHAGLLFKVYSFWFMSLMAHNCLGFRLDVSGLGCMWVRISDLELAAPISDPL